MLEIIKISIISLPTLVILTKYYTGSMIFGLFYRNFDKIYHLRDNTNYAHQK